MAFAGSPLCNALPPSHSAVARSRAGRPSWGVSDRPSFPFRVLRQGLRAASRASVTVVDRVLRNGVSAEPAEFGGGRSPRASDPKAPVVVRFGDTPVPVEHGTTLLEAALLANLDLRSYCGGNCSCGTCRVEIIEGQRSLSRRQGMEELVLGMEAAERGDRLACQAQILGPVHVRVPEWF